MDWKTEGGALVAKTEFGTYRITPRLYGAFGLTMSRNGDVLMNGEHASIGRATDVAEADHRHREEMWETL